MLALATQLNHGNVGPVNPALYGSWGRPGAADGIADVVKGTTVIIRRKVVPDSPRARGFDVASGWGTVRASAFVPALATATQAAHQDAAVRARRPQR